MLLGVDTGGTFTDFVLLTDDADGEQQIRIHKVLSTPKAPEQAILQGIDELGRGLAVEARAPDGQIEAVRVEQAAAFALGVQWHPEWRYWEDSASVALFAAFGAACRAPRWWTAPARR